MSGNNDNGQSLSISLVQTNLHWENPVANLAMLEEKIFSIEKPTDLIILPEMFTTGFSMKAQLLAEPMNHTTCRWMKQMAAQTGAVLTGSVLIKDAKNYYNRLFWVTPKGEIDTYDKRHLFRMTKEDTIYSAGKKRLIKTIKGWKICLLICYDLRFPVWSRNTHLDYDLVIYVANWPHERLHAWNCLLVARAIENQSYVVGVNRLGTDGNGFFYSGGSAIVDFKGKTLFREVNKEIIHHHTLEHKMLEEFRRGFPAFSDADNFMII